MKKVIVRAPALSMSGYGEQARFLLEVLKKRAGNDFDLFLEDIPWGKSNKVSFDDDNTEWIKSLIGKTSIYLNEVPNPEFDISIQVTIPNEWKRIARFNIGYTAGIECDRVSPTWIQKANSEIDKIITISQHSMDVFRYTNYEVIEGTKEDNTGEVREVLKLETPIEYVNYSARTSDPVKENLDLDFETNFNFLTISQFSPRKNLQTLITAFLEEFKNNSKVGLVIKMHTLNTSVLDRERTRLTLKSAVSAFPDRKCKIYMLHGEMTENQLANLYCHPKIKAYATTTHGEGFGLPIFEATCNGLPIVAPDWSGQRDYLHGNLSSSTSKIEALFRPIEHTLQEVPKEAVWDGVIESGSRWSAVSVEETSRALRDVYKNLSKFKKKASTLKDINLKRFSSEKINEQFDEILFDGLINNNVLEDINNLKEEILSIGDIKKRSRRLKKEIEKMDSQTHRIALMKDIFKGEKGSIISCGPSLLENGKEKINNLAKNTVCITVKQAYDLFGEHSDFHTYNCANFKKYDYTTSSPVTIEASTTPAALGICDLNFFIQERNVENSISAKNNFSDWTFDKQPLLRPFGPGIMFESVFYLAQHLGLSEVTTVGWDNKLVSDNMEKQHFYDQNPNEFHKEEFIHYNEVAKGTPTISLKEEESITANCIEQFSNWLKEEGCEIKICSKINPAPSSIDRVEI